MFRFIAFLFIPSLFVSPIQGQQPAKSFPKDFTGIYRGPLEITNTGKPSVTIPMEFHLLDTETSDQYEYRLIYDGQPRNYTLIVNDLVSGDLSLDENNGIILPTKLILIFTMSMIKTRFMIIGLRLYSLTQESLNLKNTARALTLI